MSRALQNQLLSRRIRPFSFLLVAFALTALLATTVIVVWLATSSPRNLWAPRVIARTYENVRLGAVVAELERDHIIPAGTRWTEPSLQNIPVTKTLEFFSNDFAVLDQVGSAAHVHIQVPVGQHGELRGPVTVRRPDPTHSDGAFGHHYRLQPR